MKPRASTFAWSDHAAALVERGLSEEDAAVVIRQTRATKAPHARARSLLPFLHARLSEEELRPLLDALVEAQARGPRAGRFVKAWRRLYVSGCPLDHIWRVLWHSFKDPDADPQDDAWLGARAATKNVEAYVALQFPRAAAAHTYGPGLGCHRLVRNARDGARKLVAVRAPTFLVEEAVDRCRAVISERLLRDVDLLARRPADGASSTTGDGDRATTALRWFDALDAVFATDRVVHDLSGDRFVLRGERTTKPRLRLRQLPAPPLPPPSGLGARIGRWSKRASIDATLADLDREEPLTWLVTVAEAAVFA